MTRGFHLGAADSRRMLFGPLHSTAPVSDAATAAAAEEADTRLKIRHLKI